jgi:pimeloyl-ACP methyl ester carboxylesterase
VYPYYFGDSGKQLYGVYDTPRSNTFRDAGVLLCYPIGQEYMRSHWASRQLVSQMCRAGLHCMRFDYYGTGDSAGMDSDADLGQWQPDVNTGLAELKDISGVSKISLVGLRFGAVIAATAPVQSLRVRKLVLWDPVVNGATYINGLREMHNARDRLKRLHRNRVQSKSEFFEELIGFRYSDRLISDIRSINLLETTEFCAPEIFLFVSEKRQEYEQLREHLESLGLLKGYQVASSGGEWNNPHEIENALIASETINAISSELTKK